MIWGYSISKFTHLIVFAVYIILSRSYTLQGFSELTYCRYACLYCINS